MVICKLITIFIINILIIFNPNIAKANFNDLKKKDISYIEFLLLKWENKLTQKAKILGPQTIIWRVQYKTLVMSVNFVEDKKILISIDAYMDPSRYKQKVYKPKISDCNIIRNLIISGKYGYSIFTAKRNNYVSSDDLKENFKAEFLSNLVLNKKEIDFILDNTFINISIISPRTEHNISCRGSIYSDELR